MHYSSKALTDYAGNICPTLASIFWNVTISHYDYWLMVHCCKSTQKREREELTCHFNIQLHVICSNSLQDTCAHSPESTTIWINTVFTIEIPLLYNSSIWMANYICASWQQLWAKSVHLCMNKAHIPHEEEGLRDATAILTTNAPRVPALFPTTTAAPVPGTHSHCPALPPTPQAAPTWPKLGEAVAGAPIRYYSRSSPVSGLLFIRYELILSNLNPI